MTFDTYKFHPSSIKHLMVKSRKAGELSETTKTYLEELYIKEVYGREKTDKLANKYMQKGIMCETDSIRLLEKVTKNTYFKNNKTYENNYLIGTPDITKPVLYDIKTSWDIWTFMGTKEEDARKDYYYQLLCYMAILDKKEGSLAYTLVNTPDILMNDELYKLSFKVDEKEVDKYKVNYIYDDIDEVKRVKIFKFEYSEEDLQAVYAKIDEARSYLNNISL